MCLAINARIFGRPEVRTVQSDDDTLAKPTTEMNVGADGQDGRAGSGQNVRSLLVASLVVAILAMIAIAALSTH